ncbi:MAG: hypothetical protein QNJ68_03800 [Microcoleaceae cyanobacterium MO_207.B10]|nr:hypothetical protein [Microcoleaceae cyanobacterium MO_207.B10]
MGKKVPVKVCLEKEWDWDEIPPDVRAEWLRREKSMIEIYVTKSHDQ